MQSGEHLSHVCDHLSDVAEAEGHSVLIIAFHCLQSQHDGLKVDTVKDKAAHQEENHAGTIPILHYRGSGSGFFLAYEDFE